MKGESRRPGVLWWPYQGPDVFLSSLPCCLSTDEENKPSLCLIAQRDASVFRRQGEACSRLSCSMSLFIKTRREKRDYPGVRLRFLNRWPKVANTGFDRCVSSSGHPLLEQ